MKHARIALIAVLGLSLAALLASCGGSSASTELNVYNWAVYLPDEIKERFQKETGIKLNYKEYSTNEEMYTTLQSGDTTWDIVFPSQDYVPILIETGYAEQLDKAKIPNLANVDAAVLETTNQFDPGNQYSVPYNIGSTAIIYWKDKVSLTEAEKSWAILGRPDLKGHVTLMDDLRETLGAALKANGHSLNTTNPDEVDQAVKTVEAWKANTLKAFDTDGVGKNFAAKNYWLVFSYPENTMAELDPAVRDQVGMFLPKEGGPKYLDSMVILKTSKNKENAYKFINFILQPDVLAAICDAYGYPGISAKANELRSTKALYTVEDLKNHELKLNLGPALETYTKAWQEKIKIGL